MVLNKEILSLEFFSHLMFLYLSVKVALILCFLFSAIKEFVNLCKSPDTDSVILQFLEAGGGAQEFIGLLQADNKKNMAAVLPVFSALQYIIMK